MEPIAKSLSLVKPKLLSTNLHPAPASYNCPVCFDVGIEIVKGKGARVCECSLRAQRARQIAAIPARFGDVKLSEIKADPKRHPKQAHVIESLKKNPEASYFLAGRPGTGKSHLMWALYRHAVESGKYRVICCTLSDLLEEYRQVFQAMQLKEVPRLPRLTVDNLHEGARYAVFLDDIDKANVTDYVAEQVYRLVNAIYENEHLLITTTNKTVSDLIKQYGKRDESRGEPIVRRIVDGACIVEMF